MRADVSDTERRLKYRRFNLRLVNSCTDAEACALVDLALGASGDRVGEIRRRPGTARPADGERPPRVYVKAEFRRPTQPLGRRIRRARAFAEGEGYRAFAAAGLAVPELLMFGEQPRWLMRGGAIVATVKLPGQNAAHTYIETQDDEIILDVARMLAAIHRRDLVHGDAVIRNFVRVDRRIYVMDFPSWGDFSRKGAEIDLARLIGSARVRGLGDNGALAVLDTYVTTWPDAVRAHIVGFQGRVLSEATRYADYIVERDRTRTARHARLRARLKPSERKGDAR